MIISICGKGGTGKTTLTGLLVAYIKGKRLGSVLAVDADPNATLGDMLGIESTQSVVGTIDDISTRKIEIPAGMTRERFIDMKIQESLVEEKGYDLLVMGRPEGPGCYCYVNNLLRDLIERLIKSYDFVVIDSEAGMEHISRRTTRVADKLLVVSDATVVGIRSALRIYRLAGDIGIKIGEARLVINKVRGDPRRLAEEAESGGMHLVDSIPFSEELFSVSLRERSVFELGAGILEGLISGLAGKILGDAKPAKPAGGEARWSC